MMPLIIAASGGAWEERDKWRRVRIEECSHTGKLRHHL
jgi:hypothetical protein